MALRELVTVLRYELQEGQLKKYLDGYKKAEKVINQTAQAAAVKLNGALRETVRTTGQMERGTNRTTSAMGRLVQATRQFSAGLQQGARQGYGEMLRQMERVETRQRRMRRAGAIGAGERFGYLGGAIQGALAAITTKSLMDMSDEWQGEQSTLGLYTKDKTERNRSRDYLFQQAQRSGLGYGAVAGTFTQIKPGLQHEGFTNDQILMLTSTLAKSGTLGKGGPEGTKNALIQFAQGVAKGSLQWADFKLIEQQSEGITQTISAAMGLSQSELQKRMSGKGGGIPIKEVAAALLKYTDTVDKKFASVPQTFQQGFVRVHNAITRAVGEWVEQYQVAAKFNKLTEYIADNIKQISVAVAGLAASWIAARVFKEIAFIFETIATVGRPLLLFFARLGSGRFVQAFARLGPLGLRFLSVIRGIGLALSGITLVGASVFAAIAAALIAAGLLIYKYWQPIKAWVTGVFQGMLAAAKPALDEIGSALSTLNPAWTSISAAITGVWNWFMQLISPVKMTSEELRNAALAGQAFGAVLGFVISTGLSGLAAMIRAIGWIISKFGTISDIASKLPMGTFDAGATLLQGAWNAISPSQVTSAGRPAGGNQSITNHAAVTVTAPSSNPAAVGAAAQRGTTKALDSFASGSWSPYQLPTPVEAN